MQLNLSENLMRQFLLFLGCMARSPPAVTNKIESNVFRDLFYFFGGSDRQIRPGIRMGKLQIHGALFAISIFPVSRIDRTRARLEGIIRLTSNSARFQSDTTDVSVTYNERYCMISILEFAPNWENCG